MQNKEKLPIANQNRKQLDTSSEASIGEMFQNDGDLLVASNDDSKSREDYILDMVWFALFICVAIEIHLQHIKKFSKVVDITYNNIPCQITGIRRVRIKLNDGSVKTLEAVRLFFI